MSMSLEQKMSVLKDIKAAMGMIEDELQAIPDNSFVILWGDVPLRSKGGRVGLGVGGKVWTLQSREAAQRAAWRFIDSVVSSNNGVDASSIKAMSSQKAFALIRVRHAELIFAMEEQMNHPPTT